METSTETSLDELLAKRERLNQAIAARLDASRREDSEWAKKNEIKVVERSFPDNFATFHRLLRAYGFAVVFHDGTLEGGRSGIPLEEAIWQAVASAFSDRLGFSEGFRHALVQEALGVKIYDASAGFAQYTPGPLCESDEGIRGVIGTLCHLLEHADTKPGEWHHCQHENGHAICKMPEHEHQAESWRTIFKAHPFLCHDMPPRDAALAAAAVNALPELIDLARDGLQYRARVLKTMR